MDLSEGQSPQRQGEPRSSPVRGGLSPDGRFEVRIEETSEREPSNYAFSVIDLKGRRRIKQLEEGGGVFSYDEVVRQGAAAALWHETGRYFAITDAGTQHSRELYMYEVATTDVRRLALPDYQQNALGRIGATQAGDVSVTELVSWKGDRLTCRLAIEPYNETRPRQARYRVDFVLRLSHGRNSAAQVRLESMGMPSR